MWALFVLPHLRSTPLLGKTQLQLGLRRLAEPGRSLFHWGAILPQQAEIVQHVDHAQR